RDRAEEEHVERDLLLVLEEDDRRHDEQDEREDQPRILQSVHWSFPGSNIARARLGPTCAYRARARSTLGTRRARKALLNDWTRRFAACGACDRRSRAAHGGSAAAPLVRISAPETSTASRPRSRTRPGDRGRAG